LAGGAEVRVDDAPSVGLYNTTSGVDRALADRFGIGETALSVYGEARLTPVPKVEITAGVRGDTYDFRTTAKGGDAWDGRRRSALASPKLSVSYAPIAEAAVYASWGQGFHSNDARGVTNPAAPQPGLVKGWFEEVGGRFEHGSLRLSGVLWRSHINSELVFNADDDTVEPDGAAKRTGYELTAFWKPWRVIDLDAVYARNDGTLDGEAAGNNAIPGAVRRTAEIGATLKGARWNTGLRLRYLGPRVLTQDDAHIAKSTTLVNLRTAWQATPRLELYAEVLNLFDRPAHDMDYYYATRLPGEPAAGIEDETFHMAEPRELRLGLKAAL
jgi:outer membrane receptor protein involved in Fe transport